MSKQLFVDPNVIRKPGQVTFEPIPCNQYQKKVKDELGNFTKEQFLNIYRDMLVLREFETMIQTIKTTSEYRGVSYTHPGPAHLGIGQEAAAVGEAFHLDVNDFIFGSHRAHCDILAKGLSAIEKLSDDELLDIMKNFLGGKTLSVVEKGEHATVKDLAIDFLLYGAMSRDLRPRDRLQPRPGRLHAHLLHALWHLSQQRHRRRQRHHRHGRGAL